jgi:type IV pilus assembly protein PilA
MSRRTHFEQQSCIWKCLLAAMIAVIFMTASSNALQSPQTPAPGTRRVASPKSTASAGASTVDKPVQPDFSWLQDLLKNKELIADFEKFSEKVKDGVQYPTARTQSNILGRLPDSTTFYVALPNYGETLHQSLDIFRQELQESVALRDFLKKNKLDAMEPKIEDGIQKFYEFSQFLGDEVVITGKLQGKEPAMLFVAEIKKPGVKEFLEKLNNQYFTDKNDRLRILDPQGLAASDSARGQAPVVLVRPDLIAIGLSVSSVREFNTQIDESGPKFAASPLGQRVAQSYQGGTNSVISVDLHQLISLIPQPKPADRIMLEKSGFGDVKYLVSDNTLTGGKSLNRMELAFNGPRHGIASWIAAPAPMGGLDFISSKAYIAADMVLKSPAQIFDDLQDIAGNAAFASLTQMEAQLKMNLKQDLLSKLGGEIAFEMRQPPMTFPEQGQTAAKPTTPPAFKVILRVLDPDGLQQTLARLLAMAPMQSGKREEDGVTFNTLTTPGANGNTTEMDYFFMDGYLVITSDAEGAREAVRAHRTGDSLAKFSKLREATPAGQSANASMIMYQNAGQMMGPMLAQLPPEIRQLLPNTTLADAKPTVFYVNAEESAFRGTTSNNINTDMSMVAIAAAIAIPNLMKASASANESAAASTIRTVNTAEVTYATVYPSQGYAPNLATLGPPPDGKCSGDSQDPEHACLLDGIVGNASCLTARWCTKNGYRFSIRSVCLGVGCNNYVVTATPVGTDAGGKSFCSVTDAVIRVHAGPPLKTPLTAAECKMWRPIQ